MIRSRSTSPDLPRSQNQWLRIQAMYLGVSLNVFRTVYVITLDVVGDRLELS